MTGQLFIVVGPSLIAELAKFGPQDGIGIVSLMDHTPGQRQFRDITQLRAYVCGKHGLSEAEFENHIADQIALSDQWGAAHEAAAVAEAHRFGAVLASHDDTTANRSLYPHKTVRALRNFPPRWRQRKPVARKGSR